MLRSLVGSEMCIRDRHKALAFESLNKKTLGALQQFEKEHGVRYSELFQLSYFKPVTMHLIDPMHNLFLGVAKHTFMTWVDMGILNSIKLERIDKRQDALKVPSDIGRLAHKMSKAHRSMKADEWKHWTLIYSIYCLTGVIPSKYVTHWCLFVNACSLLCKRTVSQTDITQAHQLLVMFCQKYVDLYGQNHCTPNMHLMLHLRECIK